MSPAEITAYAALIVTVISSIVVPWYLRRRAALKQTDAAEVVSWQSLTASIQKERDDLRRQVQDSDAEHRKRIRELESEYGRQLVEARQRIKQLEDEVAELYRRLYRGPAPGL